VKQPCSGVKGIYNTAGAVDFSLPEEVFYSVNVPEMIRWVKKGWMPLIDGGNHGLNMVYVSDYKEILEILADCLGVESPRWSVPSGLARFFAVLIQKGATLLGLDFFHISDYLSYMTLEFWICF